MKLYNYLVLGFLCIALALGAGCVQQGPPGNDTKQTCMPGNTSSCPSPTICTGCPGPNNITSFEECERAGYPIMESYPRQCRAPNGPIFLENISRPCLEAGGNWNECSNRCQLDNQGNPNAICTLMCEQLCECGGVAGFRCPEGSVCRMPSRVPDALGYCVPGTGGNLTREQAYEIARNSTCLAEGNLTENAFYNPNSHTWWIDLELKTPRTGCNPACVVDEATHTAEINWRCTGLMPPLHPDIIANTTCSAPSEQTMTLGNALQIAGSGPCADEGTLTDRQICNNVTGTWWIDLEPHTPHQGCNPACVVNISTGSSEVNWRCTGLMPS